MRITKGTPQAMAFLDLLKKEGNLTDVYSQEFFDRQPTYDEAPAPPAPRTPEDIVLLREIRDSLKK